MILLLYILDFENRKHTKFQSIGPLVSEIFFKFILKCKFQNVSCTLGFEVKHSKFFCRSFRTCIIVLSIDFAINKSF